MSAITRREFIVSYFLMVTWCLESGDTSKPKNTNNQDWAGKDSQESENENKSRNETDEKDRQETELKSDAKWPMLGYNSRNTNYNPNSDTNGYRLDPEKEWEFETKGGVYNQPAVMSGRVYVNDSEFGTYAIDVESGSLEWKVETGAHSTPAIKSNTVFVTSDKRVYALDSSSGKEVWTFDTSGVSSTPNIFEEALYVVSFNEIFALDINDGSEKWKLKKENAGKDQVSPAVSDSICVVGSNTLYAVDTNEGSKKWSFEREGWEFPSSPIIKEDTVYAEGGKMLPGSGSARIYALDIDDGGLRWEFEKGIPTTANSIAISDDTLYTVGSDSDKHLLFAIEASEGKEEWRHELDTPSSTPIVSGSGSNRTVYVGDGDEIRAFDADSGDENWHLEIQGVDVINTLTIADDVIYFGSLNGKLGAID